MSRRVDLNAAHNARREVEGERPIVELGDSSFELPASPPAAVSVGLARARRGDLDAVEAVFRSLFGDRLDEVLELGLELADVDVILEQAYGEDQGEAPASAT